MDARRERHTTMLRFKGITLRRHLTFLTLGTGHSVTSNHIPL